jgi:predicted alpha/beta hydrolase family esterase
MWTLSTYDRIMSMTRVVFIQGSGTGAYAADKRVADGLRQELGDDFAVEFPRMPDEDEPDLATWGPVITGAIERGSDRLVLIGHSGGGYLLLKYLATERPSTPIAAICIIAAPFPAGDPAWTFDGFELPEHFADHLPSDTPVFLYASKDDDSVPFAHRDLYAAAIPGSVTRTTSGGHQLEGDLGVVAADIRRVAADH